jgi:hypothetical protein
MLLKLLEATLATPRGGRHIYKVAQRIKAVQHKLSLLKKCCHQHHRLCYSVMLK